VAGRAWRKAGRYGKLIGRPPDNGHDLALAIAASTERVDHIKIVNSGLNSLKTYGKQTAPQFSTDELRAAVQAAEADDKKVMVHVNGAEPIRRTIAAGCHSIEHGFFMGTDNVKRLADAPIFWVPTAVTMAGYARHAPPGSVEADVVDRNLDHQLEQMRQARELGVKVAVGTDAGTIGVHHGRALREEIALLLSAGFTIPEAVRCATRNGALLMGLNRAGKIAPGFRATLLALPGGPQAFPENLSTPVLFMVDGQTQFDHRIKLNRL
jgi:imidazolonepropionase-like amidohydrolase